MHPDHRPCCQKPIERWVSIFPARGGEKIVFDQRAGLGLYAHIERLSQENQLDGDYIAVSRQMSGQAPQLLTPFTAKPAERPVNCTFDD